MPKKLPPARKIASGLLYEGGKLSILTLVSRILGLLREMTKAAFIGTGALAEAFTVSFILPNFFRRLFAENSMSVAFIPTFSGYIHEKDEGATREFLSATLTVLIILVLLVVAAGIAFSPWLVGLFNTDAQETIILTRIMFPFLALVSLAALFQGILNALGIFSIPALGPILFNVCFIISPFILSPFLPNPARGMAVGVIVGGVVQGVCQLPAILRCGYHLGFINPLRAFKNKGMRKMLGLIAPTLLGMAAYQINDLVSTSLASGVGAAAGLQYSIRIQELFLGIFAVSAGTVLLSHLSTKANKADWAGFSLSLSISIRLIILLALPLCVFAFLCRQEIITLLYKARAFDENSVILTANIFAFHIIGMASIAINRVVTPAFYALSNTKTPTMGGIISFAINIVFALILVTGLGGPGIALSLSIASSCNTVFLLLALARAKIPGLREQILRAVWYFITILLVSVFLALPFWLIKDWVFRTLGFGETKIFALALPLLVFGVAYLGMGGLVLFLLKDDTSKYLLQRLKKKPVQDFS